MIVSGVDGGDHNQSCVFQLYSTKYQLHLKFNIMICKKLELEVEWPANCKWEKKKKGLLQ